MTTVLVSGLAEITSLRNEKFQFQVDFSEKRAYGKIWLLSTTLASQWYVILSSNYAMNLL